MAEITMFLTSNSYTTSLGYVICYHHVIIIANQDRSSSAEMEDRSPLALNSRFF